MYCGFTKREIRVSQKANKNIKITIESEPQKEMEGTRGNERSQRQEEGEGEEERLTNDKYEMEKLIKRIQQVEREYQKLAAKLEQSKKEALENREKNRTIYVLWAESTCSPEVEMTKQEEINQMEMEQESVKVEETEITLEKSDNLKGEVAEVVRNETKANEEWSTEDIKTARQIDNEGIRANMKELDVTGTRPKQQTNKAVDREENRKKSLILLGHKEEETRIKEDRKQKEKEYTEKLIKGLMGNEENKVKYNAHRLGIFKGGTKRPVKMIFEDAETVDKLLKNGYKMKHLKGDEKLTLRRDLSLKEREELNIKLKEARRMNSQRSDAEKEFFFYKVREGKIVKHFLRKPKCRMKQKEEVTRFSV